MATVFPPDTYSYHAAAAELGVSLRHARRLVARGSLVAIKTDRRVRITTASLEKYRLIQKTEDLDADLILKGPPHMTHKLIVDRLIERLPALSEQRSAARRLGINPAKFGAMVKSGSVPTVLIGEEHFVPVTWLAEKLVAAYVPKIQPTADRIRREL